MSNENVIDLAARRAAQAAAATAQQETDPQTGLPALTPEQRAQFDMIHERLALRSGAALEEFITEALQISGGDFRRVLIEFVIACASNTAASIVCTAQLAPNGTVNHLALAEAVWDMNGKIMAEVPLDLQSSPSDEPDTDQP